MNLEEMTLTDVVARLAELDEEVRTSEDVEAVKKATEEKRCLLERKIELEALETRKAQALQLENGEVKPDEVIEERKEETKVENMITIESKEYRDAFYAMIAGNATEEQRTVLAAPISVDGDNTPKDGMAIAIPKTLDDKIWDNIHTAHPILADINTVNSGVVMEVTRHTAISNRTSSKKDGATGTNDQTNTFVKVSLAGKDFETYTELTYASAKMSQGALEDYLAQEISDELGEALAKYVFTQILSDATTSRKVSPTSDTFADVKDALKLATQATSPVIYAPASDYFDLVGATNANGTPVNVGATFGCPIKRDDAATKITIVDPKQFVLNVIQGVMIESDKDIKAHKVVVSGYERAEGCLRKVAAAAYISA